MFLLTPLLKSGSVVSDVTGRNEDSEGNDDPPLPRLLEGHGSRGTGAR